MFEMLSGFPDDVMAVSARGKLSADDYSRILVPMVEERMRQHRPLKLFFYLGPQFKGMEVGAMVEDARLGLARWRDWGAIAVVTDFAGWRDAIGFLGLIFHHPVRLFFDADFEKAKAWIVTDNPKVS